MRGVLAASPCSIPLSRRSGGHAHTRCSAHIENLHYSAARTWSQAPPTLILALLALSRSERTKGRMKSGGTLRRLVGESVLFCSDAPRPTRLPLTAIHSPRQHMPTAIFSPHPM